MHQARTLFYFTMEANVKNILHHESIQNKKGVHEWLTIKIACIHEGMRNEGTPVLLLLLLPHVVGTYVFANINKVPRCGSF